MATIPSLPSRDDVLRMARSTTDITGQLLDTAGNITRIAINTFDPRDGSGAEVLRVLRRTTAELAEASASPQAQEAFYRIVETLTRPGPCRHIPACPAESGTRARRVAEPPTWLRHEGGPAPCDHTHQTPPGPPFGRTAGM